MSSSNAADQKRLADLDIARGLCMILVVVGHMTLEFAEFSYYIFLFHMPIYFIISGLLFRTRPDIEFALNRTRSLMIPYCSFLVIVFILDNTLTNITGIISTLDWRTPKFDIIRMTFGGPSLVGAFTAFWFVGCLWISSIILNLILNRTGPRGWQIIAVMALLYGLSMISRPGLMLPHSLGTAPMAIIFLWAGLVAAPYRSRRGLVILVCAAIALACMPFLGKMDMKKVQYGTVLTPLFAISVSFCIISICYYLSKIDAISKPLSLIGEASLTIMFMHVVIIIHGREFVANKYALLALALGLPIALHWILERSAFTRRYVLGRDDTRRSHAVATDGEPLQANRKSAAVT